MTDYSGRAVDVSFVRLPEYGVRGLRFQSQQVVCLEIGELFRRMYGMDVASALGYDFLSRLVTKVDYARKRISFLHQDDFVNKGEGRVVEAPLVEGNFSVPITVDERYSGRWSLGLGAGGCSVSDGKEIRTWGGIVGVRQVLQGTPGTGLTITVMREGKRLDLPLRLRDLHPSY